MGRSEGRTLNTRRLGVCAVGLAVCGLVLAYVSVIASSQTPAATDRLDSVPGLGTTREAMERDSAIAYYEAYLREKSVASCMLEAGFEYHVDVKFPAQPVQYLAARFGLVGQEVVGMPVSTVAPLQPGAEELILSEADPVQRNNAYVANLDSSSLEGYYQALFAESSADVAFAETHGRAPDAGADDFASGGCFGGSLAELPGIWDLKRSLVGDLVELRSRKPLAEDQAAVEDAFDRCVADNGGPAGVRSVAEVEMVLGSSDPKVDVDALHQALENCDDIGADAHRKAYEVRAADFLVAHQSVLDAQVDRYEGFMELMLADEQFLTYLRNHAAWIGDANAGSTD